MEQVGYHVTMRFCECFSKIYGEIQVWLKSIKNNGTLHEHVVYL